MIKNGPTARSSSKLMRAMWRCFRTNYPLGDAWGDDGALNGWGEAPSAPPDYKTETNKKTFNILSLDGGGVWGAFTAAVLARIQRGHPSFIGYTQETHATNAYESQSLTKTNTTLELSISSLAHRRVLSSRCASQTKKPVVELLEAYETACPHIFAPRSDSYFSFGASLFSSKYDNKTLKGWC